MVMVENKILSQNFENDEEIIRTTSTNFVDDWENPEKSIPKPNSSQASLRLRSIFSLKI